MSLVVFATPREVDKLQRECPEDMSKLLQDRDASTDNFGADAISRDGGNAVKRRTLVGGERHLGSNCERRVIVRENPM